MGLALRVICIGAAVEAALLCCNKLISGTLADGPTWFLISQLPGAPLASLLLRGAAGYLPFLALLVAFQATSFAALISMLLECFSWLTEAGRHLAVSLPVRQRQPECQASGASRGFRQLRSRVLLTAWVLGCTLEVALVASNYLRPRSLPIGYPPPLRAESLADRWYTTSQSPGAAITSLLTGSDQLADRHLTTIATQSVLMSSLFFLLLQATWGRTGKQKLRTELRRPRGTA